MFCQNCSREEVDNPTFCRGCGARLVVPAIGVVKGSCPKCLREIDGDRASCPFCGEPSRPGTAKDDKNTTPTEGPMSKVFGWIGFGIGVVLMIVFIPASESMIINFIIGGAVGAVGGGIGSLVGSLLDKK